MNDVKERNLTTADLAAAADADKRAANDTTNRMSAGMDPASRTAAEIQTAGDRVDAAGRPESASRGEEQLAPLFAAELAQEFRSRWEAVQVGFVDDPRDAVRRGDELVAQVMKSLAESFAAERSKLEQQFEQTDKGSTENLRLAFRRYRSFFERLLAL